MVLQTRSDTSARALREAYGIGRISEFLNRGTGGKSSLGGTFDRTLRAKLPSVLGIASAAVELMEGALAQELALRDPASAHFLDPTKLKISVDLDAPWYQCRECTAALLPRTVRAHCASCGSPEVQTLVALVPGATGRLCPLVQHCELTAELHALFPPQSEAILSLTG